MVLIRIVGLIFVDRNLSKSFKEFYVSLMEDMTTGVFFDSMFPESKGTIQAAAFLINK
jgi:hypothetical protein